MKPTNRFERTSNARRPYRRTLLIWVFVVMLLAAGAILGWVLRANHILHERIEERAAQVANTLFHAYASFVAADNVPPEFPPDQFDRFAEIAKSRFNLDLPTPGLDDEHSKFLGARIVPIGPEQAMMWIVTFNDRRAAVVMFKRTDRLSDALGRAGNDRPPTHLDQRKDFDVLTMGEVEKQQRAGLLEHLLGDLAGQSDQASGDR